MLDIQKAIGNSDQMIKPRSYCHRLLIFCSFIITGILFSQQLTRGSEYLWPEERSNALQIVVHIWGEIKNPGQYVVPDGTTVLELISLAGGPNEFSNLTNVRLTREYYEDSMGENMYFEHPDSLGIVKKEIYKINLKKHLREKELVHIYKLKPGDVVTVVHNNWYKIQTVLKIITQVAIVGQAYYYFTRSQK